MFSSKTLAERNNDPHPWCEGPDYARFAFKCSCGCNRYMPRDRFQHGKLPANAILTEIRAGRRLPINHRSLRTELAWLSDGHIYRDRTRAEIDHAKRVLTLLATLTPPESSNHV